MRYLTKPVFALSQYGLQSLVDICRHPIFGPRVRCISFLAANLNTKGFRARVRNMTANDDLADELTRIMEYASLCKEEHLLEASGDKHKLLANALEAIDRPISIAVTNDLESIDPAEVVGFPAIAYHYNKPSGKRTIKPHDVDSKMRSWFTSLEEAIDAITRKDRIILAGLSIKLRRHSGDATFVHSRDCIVIRSLEFYSNLTTLRLDLNLEALKCPVSSKSWKDLFKLAPKLQELSFSTSYKGVRPVGVSTVQRVTELFDNEMAFKLNTLVLADVPCASACLLQLLERHKQTLMSLTLSRITLVGGWKPCLLWMRKNLNLKNLRMSHPQWIKSSSIAGVPRPRGPLTWIPASYVGQESVNAGLDSLILHA